MTKFHFYILACLGFSVLGVVSFGVLQFLANFFAFVCVLLIIWYAWKHRFDSVEY